MSVKEQEGVLLGLQQVTDIGEIFQMEIEVHLVLHFVVQRQRLAIRQENQLSDEFARIEQPNAGNECIGRIHHFKLVNVSSHMDPSLWGFSVTPWPNLNLNNCASC